MVYKIIRQDLTLSYHSGLGVVVCTALATHAPATGAFTLATPTAGTGI